jgi:hypothetical protein
MYFIFLTRAKSETICDINFIFNTKHPIDNLNNILKSHFDKVIFTGVIVRTDGQTDLSHKHFSTKLESVNKRIHSKKIIIKSKKFVMDVCLNEKIKK